MEKAAFKAGLHTLCVTFNREPTEDLAEIYAGVLGDLTDEEWHRAIQGAIRTQKFFPSPVVLIELGRPKRDGAAVAVACFDRIIRSYELGKPLGPREVREQHGEAAMESFVAAGGVSAFSNVGAEETRKWVRKSFVETWREVAKSRPELPPGPLRMLKGGKNG